MTTHQVNLEYLAEAANLLMGPQGALQLSVVYTTIENVAKRGYARGREDGVVTGWEEGLIAGQSAQDEREEIDEAYRVADEMFDHYEGFVNYPDVVTLNEAAHGDDHDVADIDLHKTHYDTWNGRFHRPGEE